MIDFTNIFLFLLRYECSNSERDSEEVRLHKKSKDALRELVALKTKPIIICDEGIQTNGSNILNYNEDRVKGLCVGKALCTPASDAQFKRNFKAGFQSSPLFGQVYNSGLGQHIWFG